MTSFKEFMTNALPNHPHVLLLIENTFLRKYKRWKSTKKKRGKKKENTLVFLSHTWIPWNLSFRYILFLPQRLQTMLWHHNARVNSLQRWKQARFRVCFYLWCELTSTINVTEWQGWIHVILRINFDSFWFELRSRRLHFVYSVIFWVGEQMFSLKRFIQCF